MSDQDIMATQADMLWEILDEYATIHHRIDSIIEMLENGQRVRAAHELGLIDSTITSRSDALNVYFYGERRGNELA